MSSSAIDFARQNYPRFLDDLKALLRIPSISTLPEHNGDCRHAAEVLAADLKRIGMENVRLIETEGHPLVYADWLHAVDKPTVLVYGHYDVQPPDPLDEWLSPPFEPTIRDGNIYARGAVDDKGQVVAQVKALESLLAATGKLPINVRVLLEGEEEVGGEGIANFVASKPPELKADFALVSDTELFAPGLPTLCVGLRGMIYTELEVRSSRTDLHSGMYGGAAPNSFVALAQILAKLKDENGHIQIPGFYDDIVPPSPEELAAWQSLPFDEEHYRISEVGSKRLVGEPGYSVLERTWARPTLDVHGIPGGFIGAGAKTVIPAKATAKVSMRLVPGMTPAKAFAQYKSFVEKIAPDGVEVDVRLIHAGDPCLIPVNNPYIQAATRALHEVWGKDTVFIRSGGSIPIVGDFDRHLGLPSVMMGFGLPDDNLHAPNEKFHLKNFSLGIESLIRFLEEAAN
ncbi:MAG TPA: dipeptidase [Terracidiphilus sp.]|jgi:acetylornithine deacetylase/succinyl-diaminopimelate desuccinylase-like protein|nr:dipeptidase [Terracidiphilus sp.]HUX28891.1 dipeptidase [Terracidiphilus sp.]